MNEKTSDEKNISTKTEKIKKNKMLFIVSILILIFSAVALAVTAVVVVVLTISIIIGKATFSVDINSLFSGISTVFGAAFAAVAFYAALRGIWQDKLIKCRKLGIVLALLSAVSFVSNILGLFSAHNGLQHIVIHMIVYASLSIIMPALYLISANIAIKKQRPKSKYKKIIKQI